MSTDEQAKLGDYSTPSGEQEETPAEGDEPAQRPNWSPEGDGHRTCLGCGAHVPADWGRTMGDNDNNAHACLKCRSGAEIQAGAAADPDFEHYHDRGVPLR